MLRPGEGGGVEAGDLLSSPWPWIGMRQIWPYPSSASMPGPGGAGTLAPRPSPGWWGQASPVRVMGGPPRAPASGVVAGAQSSLAPDGGRVDGPP